MPVEDKSKSLLPFLSSPKLLPDESEAEFQSGLQSLLSELDNPSPLAVALVSQLNECLWWIRGTPWIRSYCSMRRWRGFCLRRVATLETYDNRKYQRPLSVIWMAVRTRMKRNGLMKILAESKLTLSDLRVRAFKDAAKHIKMVDDLIHRQHQTMRHLQRSIDSIDYKSRLIKRMDLELAALESKQSVKGALTLDAKPS